MNKLYAAWLQREARERFGVGVCDLTPNQRAALVEDEVID